MKVASAALLVLILLLPPFATVSRAETATPAPAMDMLGQMPDDPAAYGSWRAFEFLDIAALRAAMELETDTRLADIERLPEAEAAAVQALLERVVAAREMAWLTRMEPARWPTTLGLDFLAADWLAQSMPPKSALAMIGGPAVPDESGLTGLALAGFAAEERDGRTIWVLGESDGERGVDAVGPGFPFWGLDKGSLRLLRGEDALVGARTWPPIEAALAVDLGLAPSLADLPRFRLAVEALSDPALSDGPILQMFMMDEGFGEGVITGRTDPEGLPRFDLLAFAERQDQSGHQLVLALTFGDKAQAEEAAHAVAESLSRHRGLKLSERFPDVEISASIYQGVDGVAAVVRLATPPEPTDGTRPGEHRSRLFEHFYKGLLHYFMIDFLVVRE